VEQTKQSVVKIHPVDRDLYLNVDYLDENRGLDEELAPLKYRTVRSILKFAARQPTFDESGFLKYE
jgi:hypothetical protein